MTLRARVAILGILLLSFIVAVPLVLFFAFGLSYDWENHDIIKTGAMVINTHPRGATIELNGEKYSRMSPAKIKHLIPGDYDIKITRSGYQDWTDFTHLSPEQVIEIGEDGRTLYLFLASTNPQLRASEVSEFVSLGNSALWRLASTTLSYQENESNAVYSSTLTFSDKIQSRLIGNQSWMVVTDDNVQYLLNPRTGVFININRLNVNPDSIISISDAAVLYLNTAGALSTLNLSTGRVDQFYPSVESFDISSNVRDVVMVSDKKVLQKDLASTTSAVLYDNLPFHNFSQVTSKNDKVYVQLDSWLYELRDDMLILLQKDVQDTFWDEATKTLFAYNLNNVWILADSADETLPLITNSQAQITNLFFSEELNKLFYLENGHVKGIDVYTKSHKITVIPIDHQVIKFVLDQKGEKVTFLTTDGSVYEANIR